MDYLSLIRKPIDTELQEFISLFNDSLSHTDGMLETVLDHIRKRAGKRMRPMLILLTAKCFGEVNESTQRAAVGLELLHTASLVHDDVVDEYLARLGQTLANGEILQLTSNGGETICEETYYEVIKQKTAALFEACCAMGAMSAGASEEDIIAAREFGQKLGIIFQIRDDIFDYYDSAEIGKPTGNDMAEGKLTLPVIHAVLSTQNPEMLAIAYKVKQHEVTKEEIAQLVAFTKENGGIEYAEDTMERLREECLSFVEDRVGDEALKTSFTAYVDYVIGRKL